MRNTSELARFLRFRLSQLSAENAHHRFEELARQFARLRICERILPATGPVSSGGDQGLDFESYRTYIRSSPFVGDSFIGDTGDEKLGFAVSLQKAIVPKIQKDVRTISGGPVKLAAIYYFCETDIPVAKRHRLQEWARKDLKVELEIFDGQALSELLTDPSLFWIAIEYLGVPADMYPMSGDVDKQYAAAREKWLVNNESIANYADFAQVKQGIRQATFETDLRPDLPGWITKMGEFNSYSLPISIRRKSAYEICVAALRGQNNPDGAFGGLAVVRIEH